MELTIGLELLVKKEALYSPLIALVFVCEDTVS